MKIWNDLLQIAQQNKMFPAFRENLWSSVPKAGERMFHVVEEKVPQVNLEVL